MTASLGTAVGPLEPVLADPTPSTPRLSKRAAATAIGYLILVTSLWYSNQDTWFGQRRMVGPLFLVGCGLVLLQVWRSGAVQRFTRETWFFAGTGLFCMAVFWYFGRAAHYPQYFGAPPDSSFGSVVPFIFMCGASVVLRLLLPWSLAWMTLGQGPRTFGAALGERSRATWVYALLLLIGVTATLLVSGRPEFLARYPMCRKAIRDDEIFIWVFVVYQFAYSFLFISGEGFSRGYLLLGLGRTLGPNAIFFALVPYVMIHFGKPALETFGAILTGLVLGTLAYRHQSFWYGALVHWLVALTMDVSAIVRRGVLLVY